MQQRSADAGASGGERAASAGLRSAEAERLLAQFGENTIREDRVHPLRKLLGYFWGPIPWMIEIAAVLSGAARQREDFGIILAMLMLNAGCSRS